MSLQSLCDLPLLKILRYLDEQSLLELSVSSSAFHGYIRRNRSRLVERRIEMIEVRRLEPHIAQDIEQYRVSLTPDSSSFSSANDYEIRETIVTIRKPSTQSSYNTDTTHPTFTQWFSKTFSNTAIESICLERVPLDTDSVWEFTRMAQVHKIRVEALELVDEIRSAEEMNAWILFCKTLQIRSLSIGDLFNVQTHHHFWTNEFIEFVPTLEDISFSSRAVHEMIVWAIPTLVGVFKFPPMFYSDGGMATSFESIWQGVQMWFEDKIAILYWSFLLSGPMWTPDTLAMTLGVPCARDERGTVVLTNRNQKKVALHTYDVPKCLQNNQFPYFRCSFYEL